MPSADSRRIFEGQIPSFMSVFDLDAETMADRDTVTLVNPKLVEMDHKTTSLAAASGNSNISSTCLSAAQAIQHRNSMTLQNSESADSSPTTTLSTTDSSPLSDPSPSSSPDSPLNLIPLNNYPSTTFRSSPSNNLSMLRPRRLDTSLTPLERPMTSPAPRKPRNMKGLSIHPPAVASAISKSTVMDPGSPSFIKPSIPAMKRKPSLLSINTNATDFIAKTSLEVVPSPALAPILQRRALKHSASSPHMRMAIKTASFAPAGGMTLPSMLERNESGLSEVLRPMKTSTHATFAEAITEEESPIKMQLASRSTFGVTENNEDQKSPGYPEGPIAIYGDQVFLFSEPSAEEASKFDVVINVAREVKNPFNERRESLVFSPVPDTAMSNMSFTTAFEYQPDDGTPTTPKANAFKAPEYIHIPWDHTTDIAPDLMTLCETIDNRTKAGKKVLVHCQQGASRSASLIIAYGLYQKPELSVNDAYYAAQAKSRWISPNMKLMYSLQDFQKKLSKKHQSLNVNASRPRVRGNPPKHKLSLSSTVINMDSSEPLSAPLPREGNEAEPQQRSDGLLKRLASNLGGFQSISPGPASAPLSFSWKDNLEEKRQKQEEENKEEMNLVEPDWMQAEPEPEPSPQRLQPPSATFRFNVQQHRPKSAQGSSKPNLAPIMLPDTKPVASVMSGPNQGFGCRNHFLSFPGMHSNHFFGDLSPIESVGSLVSPYPDGDNLVSPRAETMMGSPLRTMTDISDMRFINSMPEPAENLFSPRETTFSRNMFFSFGQPAQIADPRSPPTKGEAPIIRSIDDIL